MAPCCLFLACKVEEQPRKLEHLLKVGWNCMNKEGLDVKSEVSYAGALPSWMLWVLNYLSNCSKGCFKHSNDTDSFALQGYTFRARGRAFKVNIFCHMRVNSEFFMGSVRIMIMFSVFSEIQTVVRRVGEK